MTTMLSRSGRTDASGKLTCRIDVPVSEELNEAIIALAAVAGVPKAEFARMLWEEAVFGRLSMLRRIARTSIPGPSDQYPNTDSGQ